MAKAGRNVKKHKLRNCCLITWITTVWILIALTIASFVLSTVPLESIGMTDFGTINGQNALNAYLSMLSASAKDKIEPFSYTADDLESAQQKLKAANASFIDGAGKADFSLILKDNVKLKGEISLNGKETAAVLDKTLASAFNTGKPAYTFERIEQVEFCDIGLSKVMRIVAAFDIEESCETFKNIALVGNIPVNPILYLAVDYDIIVEQNRLSIQEPRSFTFNGLDRNTGNTMIHKVFTSFGMGDPQTYALDIKLYVQTVFDHLGANATIDSNIILNSINTEGQQ